MRFLCLHGLGTSNQLFKAQTAALRYELGDNHTYEFVQGTIRQKMPKELANISDPKDPYWAYFDPSSASSCVSALDQLGEYIDTEGPFDGIIGFSHGAVLAIAFMLRFQDAHPHTALPFKCALLFSWNRASTFLKWLKASEIRDLPISPSQIRTISLPIAAIMGANDYNPDHQDDMGLFDARKTSIFIHDGGHDIPGPHIPHSTVGSVKIIRRVIYQAQHTKKTDTTRAHMNGDQAKAIHAKGTHMNGLSTSRISQNGLHRDRPFATGNPANGVRSNSLFNDGARSDGAQIIEPTNPEPLAVVGMSYQFPGGAVDDDSFWDILTNRRCVTADFPSSRLNIDAFHSSDRKKLNTMHSRKAHFLQDDIRNFDAPFFSIPASEAGSMDPCQRGLMETAYHALESVGLDSIAGSNTSVHVGCFSSDYSTYNYRDIQKIPKYTGTGSTQAMLSNRLSWHFDLRGPSMTIDTACSSSLVALELACQGLWSGKADMALVAGANIILSPEFNIALSNMNFLSPQGRCHSFDHRADGYARGEGFAVLIVKPLSKALTDGNTLRALIRAVGSNQDGHTNGGITQPSKDMQAQLIRDAYRRANLDLGVTRFFEAHGTGTAIGDPIEARAIGEVFGAHRSDDDPLFVGAVKSNIGHLEGASGFAGVVKSILALERGKLPPNTNFERLNPAIDDEFFNLKFPEDCIDWPPGIRRASVNSFGFGGSNSHAVLDDVHSYLSSRGLEGKHLTVPTRTSAMGSGARRIPYDPSLDAAPRMELGAPQLFVFSSFDEAGILRQVKAHSSYLETCRARINPDFLSDYSYTLSTRPVLPWKSFCVVENSDQIHCLKSLTTKPSEGLSTEPTLGFVFTGQGAQWSGMGRELLDNAVFRNSLHRSQKHLHEIGATWSLVELLKTMNDDMLQQAQFGQAITTCIQLALVDLMQWLKVASTVVVGHSSGEIAAAYAAGYISQSSAVRISYFRGVLGSKLESTCTTQYSMAAIGLSREETCDEISALENTPSPMLDSQSLKVSCINSASNVTVSGPLSQLEILISHLKERGIFARKLKVNLGYHSPQMSLINVEYLSLLGKIDPGTHRQGRPRMVSSVTGSLIDAATVCLADYWTRNLTSPVDFLGAMEFCNVQPTSEIIVKTLDRQHFSEVRVDGWLEIGPHSVLQGPLRQTLKGLGRDKDVVYASALIRNTSAISSLLKAAGTLWSKNFKIDVLLLTSLDSRTAVENMVLPNIPHYSFNHSTVYWEEALSNRNVRFRTHANHDLLGTRIGDPNPFESQWKLLLSDDDMPWVREHKVDGVILYPAAGMITMALEAAKQLAQIEKRTPMGWHLENLNFPSPIKLATGKATELHIHMSAICRKEKEITEHNFRIILYKSHDSHELVCSGIIREDHGTLDSELGPGHSEMGTAVQIQNQYTVTAAACEDTWDKESMYRCLCDVAGLEYGPTFQTLDDMRYGNGGRAVATLSPQPTTSEPEPTPDYMVHPAKLDGIFQLCLVALNGMNRSQSVVPRRIGRMWIRAAGFGHSRTANEKVYSNVERAYERVTVFDVSAIDVASMQVKVNIEELEVTSFSSSTEAARTLMDTPDRCWHMDWKPDLDALNPSRIREYCESARPLEPEPIEWFKTWRDVSIQFCLRALLESQEKDITFVPSMEKYRTWLHAQIESVPEVSLLDDVSLDRLCKQILPSFRGEMYINIGLNLSKILAGDVDPLQIMFEDKSKMDGFYREVNECATGFWPLQRYLDSLVHKSPNLRFLEIGAGTGGATAPILETISGSCGRRYEEYVFTDISVAFFAQAEEKFSEHGLKYQTLNIEENLQSQGFEEGAYDVIVADNVLHATSTLHATLQNVRKLLRPGGKLILKEMTVPQSVLTGFIFGLLWGWWLGSEEERSMSPCVTEARWNDLLKASGFTGTDMVFRDCLSDECHLWSLIVSTAADENDSRPDSLPSPTFIVDDQYAQQMDLAKQLSQHPSLPAPSDIVSLHDAAALSESSAKRDFIYLEIGHPVLRELQKETFGRLQKLLTNSRSILWVREGGGGTSLQSPDYSISDGLFRVVRNEHAKMALVYLALEKVGPFAVENIAQIFAMTQAKLAADKWDFDPEYSEIKGRPSINRLSRAKDVNEHLFKRTGRPTIEEKINDQKLKLGIRCPGLLDTIEFSHDGSVDDPLLNDEVGVEVHATGLNFKDGLTLLGRVSTSNLGSECSGIIREVGTCVTDFAVGDRVIVWALDSLKTYKRVYSGHVRKIPEPMGFAEAASIPTVFCTAYFCLIHTARLKEGETILIHSASGGVGQAAVQLAQHFGAEVFATVGSQSKKELLMKVYGIEQDHILCSRDSSFAASVMHLTNNRGVDVVLNSLGGRLLESSWECIAPFGRFVEIGLGDAFARNSLPMHTFSKSASFTAADLTMVIAQKGGLRNQLLADVLKMFASGVLKLASPLSIYPLDRAEEALRFLSSGKSSGKVVLSVDRQSSLPIVQHNRVDYHFLANATYVIAGGFGGLGRYIARWLVDRGARNLIVLSRSGPRDNAQEMLTEMRKSGVNVECPTCDITELASLTQAISRCSQVMPPIKGCFQGAMVLRDSTFGSMSFSEWQECTGPKIQGSWNLHTALPSGMDFFVLLSSACGIFGNSGQANYAAGNTYEDALAAYRISRGEAAVSIDLGSVLGEGFVAERQDAMAMLPVSRQNVMDPHTLAEIGAMLDYYCDPNHELSAERSQLATGLSLPSDILRKGQDIPTYMQQPLFRYMHQLGSASKTSRTSKTESLTLQEEFTSAASKAAASLAVSNALRMKLSKLLGLDIDSIRTQDSLESYGVDSLVGLELRNWLNKQTSADIAVFEILGGATLENIGLTVASRSTLSSIKWKV